MTETEYTTIRVTKDARDEARQQKEQADRTWNEQIVRPGSEGDDAVLRAVEQLERKVERLADGVAATGGGAADDDLAARLEDIRSELPRAVAQELQA